MAEDFLEKIYREAELYTELSELRELARKDLTELVLARIRKLFPRLAEIMQSGAGSNPNATEYFRKAVEKMTEYTGENIIFTDYLDAELMPALDQYLAAYAAICVDDEQGLCLESSGHVFLTLRNTDSQRYFHSCIDPMKEAREQVLEFYSPKVQTYALLGCGLGYLAYQLYRISDGAVKMHLYEPEERMIAYGRQYGVLSWIPEECLEVTVGTDILSFLMCAEQEGNNIHIFRPEIPFWPKEAQGIIERLYAGQCSSAAFGKQRSINFFRNQNCGAKPVEEADFPWRKNSEKYIIAAGGPSLDDSLDFLRQQKGKMPILAAGTVFRKLMQTGIEPDLVAVMDPLALTMEQLRGMENEKIPLLLASTAYWKWGTLCRGEKYLAPVLTGRCEEANCYAEKAPGGGWDCGGTVTLLAVHAALYFGAKEIYLAGADFAYPDGYSHASGVSMRRQKEQEKLIPVENTAGGIVYTDPVMDGYRFRLEELIESRKDVCFFNLSSAGARIRGCKKTKTV